jgi:hypothetical protein
MKIFKTISLILLGAVIALVCVLSYSIYRGGFSAPFVTVEVINNSGSVVSKISIEHENGEVRHKELADGERVFLPVYARGESSYKIVVQFADGNTLSGGAGYVESGYKIKEIVTKTEIKSEFGALY